jgi:hypothetical protein
MYGKGVKNIKIHRIIRILSFCTAMIPLRGISGDAIPGLADFQIPDSLMENAKFGEIQSFFHEKDNQLVRHAVPLREAWNFSQRKNEYLKSVDLYNFLISQDSASQAAQISRLADSPQNLNRDLMGLLAYSAYLKLLNFWEHGESDKALCQLPVISYFWRNQRSIPGQDSVSVSRSFFDDDTTTISRLYWKRVPEPPDSSVYPVELHVTSDVPDAAVYLNGRFIGKTPRAAVRVDPGRHQLFAYKKTYDIFRLDFDVEPSDTALVADALLSDSWMRISKIPKEAEVRIDGERVGSISDSQRVGLHEGKHTVILKRIGYETKTSRIVLKRLEMPAFSWRLTPKSRIKAALYSAFVPGLGQYYSEKRIRQFLVPVLELSFISGAVYNDVKLGDTLPQYRDAEYWYLHSHSEENRRMSDIRRRGLYDRMKGFRTARSVFTGLAVGTWIFNVIDAWRSDFLGTPHRKGSPVSCGVRECITDGGRGPLVEFDLDVPLRSF